MLDAPFPWFGGKSRVADIVWPRLGDVDHYIEPFAGSLAMLLQRPATHVANVETVNDLDMYIANFWRAIAADPDAVAEHADWPVNECDLTARHLWLVNTGHERVLRLQGDASYYDAQVAGWWVWGICAWIGSGWCSGNGSWHAEDGQLVHLGDAGRGVNRQLVHLGDAGRGVNRQLVHLGDAGQGVQQWFRDLSQRLRRVRVCCGDWQRVVTDGAMTHSSTIGVFLDPPYAVSTERDATLYNHDSNGLSDAVRAWALRYGDNPRYRIALCGYEGEHQMPASWETHAYSAKAAYKSANGDQNGRRHLERIWFSPHCLRPQPSLFDGGY